METDDSEDKAPVTGVGDHQEVSTEPVREEERNISEQEPEAPVQIILEKVPDEENTDVNEFKPDEETKSESCLASTERKEVNKGDEAFQPACELREGVSSKLVLENQGYELGEILEDQIVTAVRRHSIQEDEKEKETENGSQKIGTLQESELRVPPDDCNVNLKRKLDDVDVEKSHHHRKDKERSGEHRSKEHKKSSRDREKDGERRHRDKEHRSHHDKDRHRDRKRDHREKKSSSSIGLQCSLGTQVKLEDVKEEPRLTFPDGTESDPPSVRLCGYSLANPLNSLSGLRDYKYAHLMYLELYANGGGRVLHAWQEDVDKLPEKESWVFAEEFLKEAFIEVNGLAMYCAAVVHNAAKGLPDFLEYLGDRHSNLPVKHGVIGHPRELETTTMSTYREKVRDHFCAGTFRFGHLDNLSLVGTASEEAGGFFPDILDMLDEIPILSLVCRETETCLLSSFTSSDCFRQCPGDPRVFSTTSWTGTGVMTVPFSGSDLVNRAFPPLSWASLL